MLTINHLSTSHNGRHCLKINSLNANAGEMIAIVGPNGAGKTTLLNSLASPKLNINNDIELHYRPLNLWPLVELAQHLAVLPQHHQLSFPFTAKEVVEMGATPLMLTQKRLKKEVIKWMELTDTASFAEQFYPSLSGGEKQRVHLARVLLQLSQAKRPPLLLLDEPSSAQDLGQQHAILTQLQQLAKQQNYMIMLILHDLNLVSRYCDTVWLLKEGELMMQDSPSKVLTPETINTVWGYKPQQLISESGESVLF